MSVLTQGIYAPMTMLAAMVELWMNAALTTLLVAVTSCLIHAL